MKFNVNRKLSIYTVLCFGTIACGLLSRCSSISFPSFVTLYVGDILWALMVFLGLGLIFRHKQTWTIALYALVFSFAVEFSQLYQASWINLIRHTRLGGLILGYGFKFSDLICYSLGIAIGIVIDVLVQKKNIKLTDQYVS